MFCQGSVWLFYSTTVPISDAQTKADTTPDMLSFEGVLTGIEGHVLYKKKQNKGGRNLSVFKDVKKTADKEA